MRTILPRAIYRTGHLSQLKESLFDPSRYRSHRVYTSPDGEPILETGRNYVTIWDQWDGPIHLDDETEYTVYRSVNAAEAVERGLLDAGEGWLRTKFAEIGVIEFEHLAATDDEFGDFALT